MPSRALAATAYVLVACIAASTVTAQNVSDEKISFALSLAKRIVDPTYLELVESGKDAPKFSGPTSNVKVINKGAWSASDSYEAKKMPDGAVALFTASNGKPAPVELSFTVKAKVKGDDLGG
jgi:hypothetical protein